MTIAVDPIEEANQPKGNRVVAWTVMILIVAAVVVGAWFAWTTLFAGPSESGELNIGTIPDRFRPRAMFAAPAAPAMRDGVNKLAGNLYRVQAGEYFMTLAPTETSYAPVRLMINRRDVLTPDDRLLLRFCNDSANAAIAKNLDVTPDQAKKLAAIRQQSNSGMKIADDDRNKLRDLWKNWNIAKDPAAKSAAEAALLAAMKDIGNRSVEATKQQYASMGVEIRKIVTDQQLAKFRQTRGG